MCSFTRAAPSPLSRPSTKSWTVVPSRQPISRLVCATNRENGNRLQSAWVARVGREPSFVEEVRQTVREKLLVAAADAPPRIVEYTGRGALAAWLRIIAVRAALNLRRRRGDVAPDGASDEAAAARDPE